MRKLTVALLFAAATTTAALTLPSRAARPHFDTIVPTGAQTPATWRYTTNTPASDNWKSADFNDSAWRTGRSGFGTKGTPGATVRTTWDTSDIWLRREITLPDSADLAHAQLLLHHDEDAEVYINGHPAATVHGYISDYHPTPISADARASLHPGKNLVAVHCHQTTGGQYVDLGLAVPSHVDADQYIPPAVPLVTHDPYFSIWSETDHLNDDVTRHWTGRPNPLSSTLVLDGRTYQLMGPPTGDATPLPQKSVEVTPTRSTYTFASPATKVTLTFLTPSIASDPDLVTRPVTYLTWTVSSADGKPHDATLNFAAGKQVVTPHEDQPVSTETVANPNLTIVRMGATRQPVLEHTGDRVQIDWGYLYAAAPAKDAKITRPAPGEGFHVSLPLGTLSDQPATRTLMLAYDEVYSIQLMGKNLRPYWRKTADSMPALLATSWHDFPSLQTRAADFDKELTADLTNVGGQAYARVGALAYRQAIAANGYALSDDGKKLLMFPKENSSNGCIATVDVHYPASPIYALFNPSLLEAQLDPVFDYAEHGRWKWPFAPHDLGTYPRANGQVYGGGERTEDNQMPVEETGNMILMTAAIAKARNDASFAGRHWDALTKWAAYLKDKGFDPENQLCTDDFMGHLAHNVNLSAKAIEALGAYAMLADMLGKSDVAKEYHDLAQQFAARWIKEADDGDHFRLAFDKPGTWSQKYNLVWDRILRLNLFPKSAIQKEVAFYKRTANTYGLPLDNRAPNTKTDWLCWTATLSDNPDDFKALASPIAKFLADTPSRVPFSDWYNTNDAHVIGFIARPVIGGVFIKLLDDPQTWHKYADRSK